MYELGAITVKCEPACNTIVTREREAREGEREREREREIVE